MHAFFTSSLHMCAPPRVLPYSRKGERQPVPLPLPSGALYHIDGLGRAPENSGRQDRLLNTTTPPRESGKDSSSLIAFHHGTTGYAFNRGLLSRFVDRGRACLRHRSLSPLPGPAPAMRGDAGYHHTTTSTVSPLQYPAVAMCYAEFSCEQDRSSLGSVAPCSAAGIPSSFQTHTHYLWCLQFRSSPFW
jgi:hypothetical protein